MASYFPMALTGMTRSWLMNLPEGTLTYWQELCYQFTANFESAYPPLGNETDLHAIQQHPGESLCSFIQWFSQVYNTKKHGKKWIDELLCALWGNRTSPSRATRETPFFLVHEAEVILPPEVTMGSLQVQTYDEAVQDQLQHEDVDLVNKRRWQSAIKNLWYHQALRHHQQWFMHTRELQVDDLVLQLVPTQEGTSKLSPGWEGPSE
jgi:hypothetical protein